MAILGGDEVEKGTVTVKNLKAQSQQVYTQADAGGKIREELTTRG